MLVMHVISNLGSGGAEASLYQLVKNNDGDQQIIVSLQDDGVYGNRLRQQGASVYCLNMTPGRVSFGGLKALFSIIKNTQPDTIQTWMYHSDLVGGIIAWLSGHRNVFWGIHHSNLDRKANSRTLLWVVRACAALSWFVPKKIISCSIRSMEVHQEWHYRKSKFTVVPNGYDIQRFDANIEKRKLFRQNLEVADDEILFGMVGRWHPQKDHEVLIKALLEVNRETNRLVRCVLVGENMSAENKELISILNTQNAKHLFVLLGTTNDVPAVMNGIDIHVLSSQGEAFPNVVAESMACQTPCVVTDVGDAAIIVGKTGWVVPPQSPKALAAGIFAAMDAAKDTVKWNKRRLSCRARIVNEYEIKSVVDQYRKVWQGT